MNQLEYAVASEEFLTKMNGIRDSINEDITDAMKNLCNLMGVSKASILRSLRLLRILSSLAMLRI